MTDTGLFREFAPQLVELENACMSMDGRTHEEFKRDMIERCDVRAKGFLAAVLSTIDKKRGGYRMLLKDIKIYPCFWESMPAPGKMDGKRQYLRENGTFQSEIVLDEDGYLIDGFTSYLLARERGIIDVPVRYGKRQVIQAYHRPGGKLYTWELPERLTGQVSAGDEVVVHTQRGVRCVTVAAVRRYLPRSSAGRMQMAIKRKGRARVSKGDDQL